MNRYFVQQAIAAIVSAIIAVVSAIVVNVLIKIGLIDWIGSLFFGLIGIWMPWLAKRLQSA